MENLNQILNSDQVEPRISVRLPEPGRIDLLVRIPVPARRKGKIEQAILRRYLESRKNHSDKQGNTAA